MIDVLPLLRPHPFSLTYLILREGRLKGASIPYGKANRDLG